MFLSWMTEKGNPVCVIEITIDHLSVNCFLSITFTKMQCEEALLFMEPSLKQCKKIFIFQRMSIGVLLGELQQYVPLSFIWKKMCPKLFLWQAVVWLHAWMHKLQVFFSLSIFTKLAKIRCFLNYVEGIFNELTWVNVISKSPESLRWSIAIGFLPSLSVAMRRVFEIK